MLITGQAPIRPICEEFAIPPHPLSVSFLIGTSVYLLPSKLFLEQ